MDIYDMECSKPSPTQPRSIPLPFLERTEHAALRDAVSTYSRCLTFSIRMDEIGEEIYIGEEKSTVSNFSRETLRVCTTEEGI